LPALVASSERSQAENISPIPFSPGWTIVALVISALFIGVIGPGIRF